MLRPQLSRRALRIGSVLSGGLGLVLLYLDTNLTILGQKGMGQLHFSGTPLKVLWVVVGLLTVSILLALRSLQRTK